MTDIKLFIQGLVYLSARQITLYMAVFYFEFLKLIEAL